jgi:hypothetical protein
MPLPDSFVPTKDHLLRSLKLEESRIDPIFCEAVFHALKGINRIRKLCICQLLMDPDEAIEITLEAARALGTCKNLRQLMVLELSDQSLCRLAEDLRTNHALENCYCGY